MRMLKVLTLDDLIQYLTLLLPAAAGNNSSLLITAYHMTMKRPGNISCTLFVDADFV